MLYQVRKGKLVEMPLRDYLICRFADLILDYLLRRADSSKLSEWLAGLWHDRVWREKAG